MWFVRTERPCAGSRGAKGRARATLERYSRKPRGVCAGRTTGPGGASWRACGVSSGGCSRSTTSRRPSRRSTRCDPSRAPSRRCKDASAVSALPITARGRQCEEGFFQWRGERKGAGHENRSKALTMDSGFVLADGARLATNLTTGNFRESKRRGERVRSATSVDSVFVVSSGFVARRRRGQFSRVIVNQSYQNQSTFASVPSLFASDSSRSASSASRSAAYWSASAHTGWDANPASPPLILGGCA